MKKKILVTAIAIGTLAFINTAFSETPHHALSPQLAQQLSAEWWQLISSLPTDVNPQFDDSSGECVVGQRGDVWLLAGTFSGEPTTRTCSVPEGKGLYFPVINQYQFNSPNVCGQDGESLTARQMRANIAPLINDATNLSVTLDGKMVKTIQRVKSDVFDVALPEQNIYTYFGILPCPAGIYSPAVDDGYYAYIKKLNPGPHILHIHAESGAFIVDNTYNLTVVPVTLK